MVGISVSDKVSSFYHNVQFPRLYDKKEINAKTSDFYLKDFLELKFLPYHAKILDAGCGTGRLQTVNRDANPLYYDLINEFYKITGVPVIINTSMNVMGEPIVNTPKQAYSMIINTNMDCIVMGNNLVRK